jgi:murein L,D-transpeptidase YcbB/YkuD
VRIPAAFAKEKPHVIRRRSWGLLALALTGFATPLCPALSAPSAVDAAPQVIPTSAQPAAPASPDTEIKVRLDGPAAHVAGDRLHLPLLRRFYAQHEFLPVWDGRQAQAATLVQAVQRSGEHGLDPDLFHGHLLAKAASLSPIDRELLLSDAVLAYADALAHGAVRQGSRLDEEDLTADPVDVVAVLDTAISSPNPVATIEALAPNSPAYMGMRQAYELYRSVAKAGGWPRVAGPQQVQQLQQRLAAERYLPASARSGVYDEATTQAVRAFQRRHGIEADGRLGASTLVELNVGADERARQVAVNLERLRWLPRQMPADRVVVNTARAELRLYRADKVVFTTRVVVGEIDKQTPEFRAKIESVLFNPPWNVPYSIATKEIMPKLAANPSYLEHHHMQRRGNGGFQQLPGPGNALGQLKFEMPNRFDVYLHDTPMKTLFSRDNRRQSHGCVRVQNPRDLASLLLDEPVDGINKSVALTYTHRRALPTALPVFLVYQTVFVEGGGVEFHKDFYERDEDIARALSRTPQPPMAEQTPSSQRRS